ncbi:MAG TPA: hypothetical protein VNM48_01750 [Chloroflexota bacterium]|nr:hypothetical protein [Chloroflexota bacterium]
MSADDPLRSAWSRVPWRRVPGFRSGTRWKQIVASLGYGFVGLILLGTLNRATGNVPALTPAATAQPASVATSPPVAPTLPPVTAVPAQPSPPPAPTAAPRVTSSVSQPCLVGQVKGNRQSRIYHVPGGSSYGATTQNVECFDSQAQAQAGGYRAAAN